MGIKEGNIGVIQRGALAKAVEHKAMNVTVDPGRGLIEGAKGLEAVARTMGKFGEIAEKHEVFKQRNQDQIEEAERGVATAQANLNTLRNKKRMFERHEAGGVDVSDQELADAQRAIEKNQIVLNGLRNIQSRGFKGWSLNTNQTRRNMVDPFKNGYEVPRTEEETYKANINAFNAYLRSVGEDPKKVIGKTESEDIDSTIEKQLAEDRLRMEKAKEKAKAKKKGVML